MQEVADKLKDRFPQFLIGKDSFRGDETVIVRREGIFEVLKFLRDDGELKFDLLVDLCGVDWPGREMRFEVVYHLYSVKNKKRIRVKTQVPINDPTVKSVTSLWKAADWFEREAFDLFGIVFEGHPNLKRLLMYEGFEGHPLRKDYPIEKRQGIPVPDKMVTD